MFQNEAPTPFHYGSNPRLADEQELPARQRKDAACPKCTRTVWALSGACTTWPDSRRDAHAQRFYDQSDDGIDRGLELEAEDTKPSQRNLSCVKRCGCIDSRNCDKVYNECIKIGGKFKNGTATGADGSDCDWSIWAKKSCIEGFDYFHTIIQVVQRYRINIPWPNICLSHPKIAIILLQLYIG